MRSMRQAFFVYLLLAAPLACPLAFPARATAADEQDKYADGTTHFRVPLNPKGQRHGTYTAYFPGGKLIQERSHYENGELSGPRNLFDEKGNPLAEETWVHGKLVCPKSQRMIEAARVKILKDSAASVLKSGRPSNANAPSAEVLARALAKVNTYRYLCDVPYDVVLDNDQINLCQYASELLVKIGHLTHTPERPAGMDEMSYKLGRDGCGRSNLFMGGDAVASVDVYMSDSDPSNIDRLGHRRWVLNPAMGKTGFGMAGKFSAMYSFDGSRQDAPDYDFVCYPPRGYCPMNLFDAGRAWHATLNPKKYKVDDKAELNIYPVDSKLKRADHPLDLNYKHVNRDGFGVPNAVIARPKNFAARPGTVYEVAVTGLQTTDGKPAEVSYFVTFY